MKTYYSQLYLIYIYIYRMSEIPNLKKKNGLLVNELNSIEEK